MKQQTCGLHSLVLSTGRHAHLTLNLTIVNPWGIWQCSDHRLTNTVTRKVEDDYSIKHLILRCPDGAALLAYAGAGRINSLDLSDWLREILRGESRTFDQTCIHIRESSTRDLAPLLRVEKIRHMFSIGAFLQGQPWAVQIRNFDPAAGSVILDRFDTIAKPISNGGQGFIFPDDPVAVVLSDQKRLMTAATRKPREPKEFSKLLASINHRSAATTVGRTISPGCITTYMPPTCEPFMVDFHRTTGAPKPLIVPFLLFGVDLTEMHSVLTQDTAIEEAGKRSVLPRNRLRRNKS